MTCPEPADPSVLLLPHQFYQNRLLHMEAVFCFFKQFIRVNLKHVLRDLLPPVGRQAVLHHGAGLCVL